MFAQADARKAQMYRREDWLSPVQVGVKAVHLCPTGRQGSGEEEEQDGGEGRQTQFERPAGRGGEGGWDANIAGIAGQGGEAVDADGGAFSRLHGRTVWELQICDAGQRDRLQHGVERRRPNAGRRGEPVSRRI